MKKLFPLLLFACACTGTPPESGERRNLPLDTTPAVTASSGAGYQEVEDTTTPKFSSVYAFLDSVKPYGEEIHRFSSSWYAYAYGNDYKGFQQFGVVFPFQYVIQDSVGAEKTLILSSVNDFAAFRRNQYPGLNAWGLEHFGSPRRVIWEGTPNELYGGDRHENIPVDLENDAAIVTYLFPMNKVDYYFRREEGIWRVFKRVQKKYSQRELQNIGQQSFEGFALRFISDIPFRMKRIKWPLKRVASPMDPDQGSTEVTFGSADEPYHQEPWLGRSIMAVYKGHQKKMIEGDTMYFRIKDEGCATGGEVFTKINNRWTLIETWDGSN